MALNRNKTTHHQQGCSKKQAHVSAWLVGFLYCPECERHIRSEEAKTPDKQAAPRRVLTTPKPRKWVA